MRGGRATTSRRAHNRSRSHALWRKGEHSGFRQQVEAILVDDDQDALVLKVRLEGPGSCHVGYRSSFCRAVNLDAAGAGSGPFGLRQLEEQAAFDAAAVYAGLPNPIRL